MERMHAEQECLWQVLNRVEEISDGSVTKLTKLLVEAMESLPKDALTESGKRSIQGIARAPITPIVAFLEQESGTEEEFHRRSNAQEHQTLTLTLTLIRSPDQSLNKQI